jgi:A/G-specific adenine glycosylase
VNQRRPNDESQNQFPQHDPVWRDSAWRSRLRRRLIEWFDANARDLPWRIDPTPYRVWVSEIMLQQTQVATVIPYYQRFLESYPTLQDLAATDEATLLSHWEGLGYYRRARSMHAAARQIVDLHGGQFPAQFDQVLDLPGVGRYTAGAILSISANQRLPILEGNTQRVFSRWISMRGSIRERQSINLLWKVAESMLPRRQPGKFNQAAMELGALICTPKNPNCEQCPVSGICRARRDGLQEEIPGKVTNLRYEDRIEYALLLGKDDGYLLRPLPSDGRWAGLWDFPRTTTESYSSVEAAAKHLSGAIGIELAAKHHVTTIRHSVTKYRISLHVHHAELLDHRRKPPRPWRYVSVDQMADLPMSVTGRKIASLLT